MQNKKQIGIKLKAGALQYTIFIAVVIALLLFAFISFTFTQQHFKAKASHYIQAIQNTNLAIDYTSNTQISYANLITIEFQELAKDKTNIEKKHWGIFDWVKTTSTLQKETFTKNALLGGFLQEHPALYLQNNNQPLVVVGNTRIEGNAFLPKQGVKRGTIAGNSYAGQQLVYGNTTLSQNKLPMFKNKKYIKEMSQGYTQFANTIPFELQENLSLLNSFEKQTQLFFSPDIIDLRHIKLVGNIIVKSNSKIRVHATTILTDVILIAPKIEILNKVQGNFQAFASKNIKLGKNCKLNYPSALVLYEKDKKEASNQQNNQNKEIDQITIDSGSEIRGIVAYLSDNKANNFKAQVLLEEDTRIIGEVYCNQNLELKGTVIGSVYTNRFVANQFGSIYQNHIYNGKIVSRKLPKQYCGLAFEKSLTKVGKWLY